MSEKNSSSFSPKSFHISSEQNQSQFEESLHSVNVEKEDAVIQMTNDEVEKFYVMLSFSFYNQQKKQFSNEKKAPRSLVINSALTSGLSSSMDKHRFIKGKTDSMRNQNSSRCLQNILHSNKLSDSTTESQHQLHFNTNSKNSNETISKKTYQQISQLQNQTRPFELLYQNKDDRAFSVKQMNRIFKEDSSPHRDHLDDSKESSHDNNQKFSPKTNIKQQKVQLQTKPSYKKNLNIEKYESLLNQWILGQTMQKSHRELNKKNKISYKSPYQLMTQTQSTKTQPSLNSHQDSSNKLLNKINISFLKKILKKGQVQNIFSHKQSRNSPTSLNSQQFSFNSARQREPQTHNKLVDIITSPYTSHSEFNQNLKSPQRLNQQKNKNYFQDQQQFYLDREIINFFQKHKEVGKFRTHNEDDRFNYGFFQLKKETPKQQTKVNQEVEKYIKVMKNKIK